MNSEQRITLPREAYRLEEINLPPDLANLLAGKVITAEVDPELEPGIRQFDMACLPQELPFLIDPQGNVWNDYWPMRVSFLDPQGEKWRIPRHWLTQRASPPKEEAPYEVTREITWTEELHLPSWWDLWDINITLGEVWKVGGKPNLIEVCAAPHRQVQVFWRDSTGKAWRMPHDWRRRRIQLPAYDLLLENGVPPDVAEEFAGKSVSVNYHPGSLCCLPDGYRFRDGHSGRWPVRAIDCLLLGYGDRDERLA
jgi:hypothetical protein